MIFIKLLSFSNPIFVPSADWIKAVRSFTSLQITKQNFMGDLCLIRYSSLTHETDEEKY